MTSIHSKRPVIVALWLLKAFAPIIAFDQDRPGIIPDSYTSPLPKTYIKEDELPLRFSWTSVGGESFLTKMLNQHIPQYCGSCWAHSAVSVIADRIKIARGGKGEDINLAVQFLLNCGAEKAGSCQGGSALRAFQFIRDVGYIPYDTCQGYLACSSNSTGGFCPFVDTSCSPMNICRTCTNPRNNGTCAAISRFPNATVAEYGTYELDLHGMKAEIFVRGPVKASVNAGPLLNYSGGVIYDSPETRNTTHNHGVSIVGWGVEKATNASYWIVRNSWGEYYGELGFFRVELGKNLLGIEAHVAWATPGHFSTSNIPCFEDGNNCGQDAARQYRDPSNDVASVKRRLRMR